MNKTPTTLIIMDGFGLSNDTVGNAVRAANTPVLDGLFADGQYAIVRALSVRLDGLEDIGVVAARQTAVTRDNDIQAAVRIPPGEIRAVEPRVRADNVIQRAVERLKIWAAALDALLGTAQLAGCHKLHGLSLIHI